MESEEQLMGAVMHEFTEKNRFSINLSSAFSGLKAFRLEFSTVLIALFSFLLASLFLNFLHFFDFAQVTVLGAFIFPVLRFFLPKKLLFLQFSKNDFLVLLAFVFLYFFFHLALNSLLFGGDQSFYYDYAVKTSEAKYLSSSLDELFVGISMPPMFNFLAAYFYMLFHNEFMLYLLPFLFYLLFILLMINWFKEQGLNVFLLGILLLSSAVWLQYSVQLLRETVFVFFVTAFFYLMHKFSQTKYNHLVAYALMALILAVFTKIAGVFLFLFFGLYFVFVGRVDLRLLVFPAIILAAWFLSGPQNFSFFLNIFLVSTSLPALIFSANPTELIASLFSFVLFPVYLISIALFPLARNNRFFVLSTAFLVFFSFSLGRQGYGVLNYYRYGIEFFGVFLFIAASQLQAAARSYKWFTNFLALFFAFSFINPFAFSLNKLLFFFAAIPPVLEEAVLPENAFFTVIFFLVQVAAAYYLARFVVTKRLTSFFSNPALVVLFLMVFNLLALFYLLSVKGVEGFNILFYNFPNIFQIMGGFFPLFFP